MQPLYLLLVVILLQHAPLTLGAMLQAPLRASEAVTVSVTLPVTVPFQVPAGQSFIDASVEFCEKNGLPLDNAHDLARALQAKWEDTQRSNREALAQCMQWKQTYDVVPLKSWGTLPQNLRQQWMRQDCDGLVPGHVVATLTVKMGENEAVLELNQGEQVEEAVRKFCAAQGIDLAENGPMLERALSNRLQRLNEQVEQEVGEEEEEKPFLFSIPVSINGTVVKLNVREGDKLDPLVTTFCGKCNGLSLDTVLSSAEKHIEVNAIPYDRYGTLLKEEVIRALTDLQEHLMHKARLEGDQRPEDAGSQPEEKTKNKLFSFPITVDGQDTAIDIYDGDELRSRVADFCNVHGIDAATHGQTLVDAVMDKVRMLQQQDASLLSVDGV